MVVKLKMRKKQQQQKGKQHMPYQRGAGLKKVG